MTNELHKWVICLGLLGMLIDTVVARPHSEGKVEYQSKGIVPPHSVDGFASERQWLFAHGNFRNQCVLEAVAAEEKKLKESVETASTRLNDSQPPIFLVATSY